MALTFAIDGNGHPFDHGNPHGPPAWANP